MSTVLAGAAGSALVLELLLWAAVPPAAPEASAPLPEASTLLEGLAKRQRRFEAALDDYTYDLETVTEKLDKRGGVARKVWKQYEVFFVKGKRVRRQVAEDGKPLAPDRQAKVDREVRKYVEDVLAGKARPPRHSGTELSDILARYHLRSVAREVVDGRPAVVLDFEALPGKRDLEGDFALRRLAGRVWMDEEERAVVRAEVRSTGKIKVALGLGASIGATSVRSEFVKVEEGVWLPRRIETQVEGRILLVKGIRERTTATFDRYRRFTAESSEQATLPEP